MHERSDRLLVALVIAAVVLAAAVLAGEVRSDPARQARSRDFQHLVGGLGFGPCTDLSPCPFAFDPRLSPACRADIGPLPGSHDLCPYHAGSVFFYPPLGPSAPAVTEEGPDDQGR